MATMSTEIRKSILKQYSTNSRLITVRLHK